MEVNESDQRKEVGLSEVKETVGGAHDIVEMLFSRSKQHFFYPYNGESRQVSSNFLFLLFFFW